MPESSVTASAKSVKVTLTQIDDSVVTGFVVTGNATGLVIAQSPQPHLVGSYTAFGQVVGGVEVLDRLELGDRILRIGGDRQE